VQLVVEVREAAEPSAWARRVPTMAAPPPPARSRVALVLALLVGLAVLLAVVLSRR
jgi:hypothetical protein